MLDVFRLLCIVSEFDQGARSALSLRQNKKRLETNGCLDEVEECTPISHQTKGGREDSRERRDCQSELFKDDSDRNKVVCVRTCACVCVFSLSP